MPKPWKRGFHYKTASGRTIFSSKPVFDDPRKAAQWAEKGTGFYNTSGKWVSTGSKPSPVEIKEAAIRSAKVANKKIQQMQKANLHEFSAELKKHTVFTDSKGFFKTNLSGFSQSEVEAMLQQVADFNENSETLEDLEEAKSFYEDFIEEDEEEEDEEEMTEAERDEKIKELRKLVDTAAQEIYDLTRDSDFLDHLYNTIDKDLDRMEYIQQYAGNWAENAENPTFKKWASYDYSYFSDL